MSEIRNQRRNGALGKIADALQWIKDSANTYVLDKDIPVVGGMGPGDFLLGKMPAEVNDWSYGNAPFQIPEMSRIPQVKTGRKEQLMDTMFAGDVVGALGMAGAKMGGRAIDGLAQSTMEAPMKASRRNFLAGTGALAATAAAGGLPAVLKASAKDVAGEAGTLAKAAATPSNVAEIAARAAAYKSRLSELINGSPFWNGMIGPGDDGFEEILEEVAKRSAEVNLDPYKAYNILGTHASYPDKPIPFSPEEARKMLDGPMDNDATWSAVMDFGGNRMLQHAYGYTEDQLNRVQQAWDKFEF